MKVETIKQSFGGSLSRTGAGYWLYQKGSGSNRIRISTKEIDLDRAIVVAEKFSKRVIVSVSNGFGKAYPGDYWDAFKNTRKNAMKRGIPFELAMDEFEEIVQRCAGACEVTGIVLQRTKDLPSGDRQPFMPSIDRINSALGYTKDNVRIVCISANLAMNTWGVWVIEELARALAKTRKADLGSNFRRLNK